MDQAIRFGMTVMSIIRHRAVTPNHKRMPDDATLIAACQDCDDSGMRTGFALNRTLNPIPRPCSHYTAIAHALAIVEGLPTAERERMARGEGRAEALIYGLKVLEPVGA